MTLRPHNIALTAFLLIACLSLFAWWSTNIQRVSNLNWKTLPPDIPTLPDFGLRNANLADHTQSLERPLFWESRRPRAQPTASTEQTKTAPVPMELLGIVSEGSQRIALLRPLQGTTPLTVHRMRQGDSAQGISIQSIDDNSVTIQSRNGIQTLKIARGSLGKPKPSPSQGIAAPGNVSSDAQQINLSKPTSPALTAQERSEQLQKNIQQHIERLQRNAKEQATPAAPVQK